MSEPFLLLFDIDGTILADAEQEHFDALWLSIELIFGIPGAERWDVDKAGRTDLEIARLVLERAGVDGASFEARRDELEAAWVEAFRKLCPPDLREKLVPGVEHLLSRLARCPNVRLGLMTGNLEPIARLKLGRACVGAFFSDGTGGFGSDAEARGTLPDVARSRCQLHGAAWPRERTFVIGDTPRDIAAARAAGVRCIAVATGRHSAAELASADAVAEDAPALERILLELAGCDSAPEIVPEELSKHGEGG